MEIVEYQNLAYRTMNHDLTWKEQGKHALHGMVSEIGELHGIYQKTYQGHEFNEEHAKKRTRRFNVVYRGILYCPRLGA